MIVMHVGGVYWCHSLALAQLERPAGCRLRQVRPQVLQLSHLQEGRQRDVYCSNSYGTIEPTRQPQLGVCMSAAGFRVAADIAQ
jgi:hypothetical protein